MRLGENLPLKKITTCERCDGNRQLHGEIQELKEIVKNQNKAIMEVLAAHNILLKDLLHQESIADKLTEKFPLKSVEDIDTVNAELSGPNKSIYVKAMKSLLRGKLTKTLDSGLSIDLITSINIDGIHGKTSLKAYKKFFEALLDAIDDVDPMKELRTALSVIKKRYFHKMCIQKAAAKSNNNNSNPPQ